jgi:phosphoglycolate phosphatase
MLSRLRVLGYFRGVFGLSDLFARSKLDVGRQLLARMAVPPDRALLVGDTTHDWEIAREMRCACVLLAGGHEAERRLRRCPCPLLPRIADILDLF